MNRINKTETQGNRLEIRPEEAPPYRVYVESGFGPDFARELKEIIRGKIFVISQKGLEAAVLEPLMAELREAAGDALHPEPLLLEPGEKNKHLNRLGDVYDRLIEWGADRKSVLIAAGGGVVGDFTGFVAATLLRGIDFVQVPTTLLAAVDASVGGKTAVNVSRGKNMVGAFHQPRLVYFNTGFLRTLPDDEIRCGLAEMVKHAFLESSGTVLDYLREHATAMREVESPVLRRAVLESISVKAAVVEQDEREGGLRAVLNLGHTAAHAVESVTNYEKFSHGDAVSRGLVTMLLLSRDKAGLSAENVEECLALMKTLELPLDTAGLSTAEVHDHLKYDKKSEAGFPRFVLLSAPGQVEYGREISSDEFRRAWDEQRERFG